MLSDLAATFNQHTQLVAVHVRRGDYLNAKLTNEHGALSAYYYNEAWETLYARVRLSSGVDSADNLVVLVFGVDDSLSWARKWLKFPNSKAVRFVAPAQDTGQTVSADVEMLALSLVDYFILPHSTFSWWAHIYAKCRRQLPRWWMVPGRYSRQAAKEALYILPHRWHKRLDKNLSLTFLYMQSEYLIPQVKNLFEGPYN